MTIMHERYRPKADTGADMLSHKGEEGGIVVAGRIELTVGAQSRVLGPGRRVLLHQRRAAPVPQLRRRAV